MVAKKLLAIVLPCTAAITLIGTGFASWYFGHDELVSDPSNISVYTASKTENGVLSLVSAPSRAVFSQGKGETQNLKDGIDYYTLKDSSYVEDDKVTIKFVLKDQGDEISGHSFRLFISFADDTFSSFVSLSEAYLAASSNDGYDFSNEVTKSSTVTEDEPYGSFGYTLSLGEAIEYASASKKPLSKELYESLQSALKNASITIKFTVI